MEPATLVLVIFGAALFLGVCLAGMIAYLSARSSGSGRARGGRRTHASLKNPARADAGNDSYVASTIYMHTAAGAAASGHSPEHHSSSPSAHSSTYDSGAGSAFVQGATAGYDAGVSAGGYDGGGSSGGGDGGGSSGGGD